jgi:hypothetical protein
MCILSEAGGVYDFRRFPAQEGGLGVLVAVSRRNEQGQRRQCYLSAHLAQDGARAAAPLIEYLSR